LDATYFENFFICYGVNLNPASRDVLPVISRMVFDQTPTIFFWKKCKNWLFFLSGHFLQMSSFMFKREYSHRLIFAILQNHKTGSHQKYDLFSQLLQNSKRHRHSTSSQEAYIGGK